MHTARQRTSSACGQCGGRVRAAGALASGSPEPTAPGVGPRRHERRKAPRAAIKAVIPVLLISASLLDRPAAQSRQPPPVFRTGTELVLVNVVVRDKNGEVVRGLTKDDFKVFEDNKPQTIESFDFEELDRPDVPALPSEPSAAVLTTPTAPTAAPIATAPPPKVDLRGRRLIVLFFDLSSMQPEEIERSVRAGRDYVDRQLSPADLIAVASFSTRLRVDQDFTANREDIEQALGRFSGSSGQGFDQGTIGDAAGTPDTGGAFTPDETEFNIFNTDRRLDALQSLSGALAGIEQKKSVVYFSSGMNQSGADNQVQLRRTIDRAVRANVSIYAADMRGLQAMVPGGEASQASTRGVSPFSGASVTNQFTHLAATQDTLTTMAEDTGGRAFFDSNNFGDVFKRVVQDTSAYYVLGFSSTNPARDGRFRRIAVRVGQPDVKLEYRSGYYAARDFAHSTKVDREQQLQDQMASDLSATDLSAYVAAAYFRLAENRFFVPVSIVVPGYQVPFTRETDKNKATIDVLGLMRDAEKRPVGRIRDTVKLGGDGAHDLKRKTVQYETGFELAPGKYHLKVVLRENLDGTMGSYETDLLVPDLKRDAVKVSSVVVGTQMQEGARSDERNPLVHDGRELVPNVTHVVTPGQHLYFYYEVYDPASRTPPGIKVLTSIAFFRGRVRAFETQVVESDQLASPNRKTAVFQLDVPAASLPPGLYTCQVNIVDDVAGTFAFPRLQLYVRK